MLHNLLLVHFNSFNLKSFLILLYFIAIVLWNQAYVTATKAFYYFILVSCLMPLFFKRRKMPLFLILTSAFLFLLGVLNILLVGNLTFPKIFLLIASVNLAFIMASEDIKTNCFLLALYVNIAVVLYHFAAYGFTQPVYDHSSNNYISVHTLAPTVLYYTLVEKKSNVIPLYPAFLVLLISFFAGGRGGILSSLFLFLGLVFFKCFDVNWKRPITVFYTLFGLFCLLIFAYLAVPFFINSFSNLRIINHFQESGMVSFGRFRLLFDYLESLSNNMNLLFGTRLATLDSAIIYELNLHNSFLFIHAYLGIAGWIAIIYFFICDFVFCYRYKKWIYFFCLTAFSLRGFTDFVFGATYYSPVFIFLLLYPRLLRLHGLKV